MNGVVHASHALIQPIAADDVATAVGRTALSEPINGTIEVAGPEQFGLDELISKYLTLEGDPRRVVTDPEARYFGVLLQERTLAPDTGVLIFPTRFEDWATRPST